MLSLFKDKSQRPAPFLKQLKARYGAFSPLNPSEQMWAFKKGTAVTSAFCLFYREWESGILGESRWGLKWAAARSEKELASTVPHLPELFRKLKAASVAVRVPMASHSLVQMLERAGFHYVGGLVTLKMDPQESSLPVPAGKVPIRSAEKKDMAALTLIAREAFREGRFYHEPGLKAGAAQKIYGAWGRNMLNYGDEVKVAGKNPLGFVSLKKDSENNRLWIDLIAVAPKAQSKGIGAVLARESRRAASRLKSWDLGVKTEPENLGALRFYLKNGFRLESFQLDYIWRAKK